MSELTVDTRHDKLDILQFMRTEQIYTTVRARNALRCSGANYHQMQAVANGGCVRAYAIATCLQYARHYVSGRSISLLQWMYFQ